MGNLFVVGGFDDNKVYADEISEGDGINDPFAGFGGEDITLSPSDQAAGIDLLAATSSLTVDTSSLSSNAEPGGTAYAKSNVTYSATGDVANWALKVSYASGSSALAYEGTGSGTTMEGVGGIALTSAEADNKWGYAWTDTTNDAATTQVYQTMPAYGSPTTIKSDTKATSASGVTGAIHFAAKFAANAIPGHYRTKVLLSLVVTPSVTYTLSFNAGSGGSGAPAAQTCTTGSTCDINIPYTIPTKAGYSFQGWGESSNSTSATYVAGGKITMTADKTLYAVWKQVFNNITNMQQMTTSICSNATIGDTAILTDVRDNSTYTVKKLSDGKCWMTQNLRLTKESIEANNGLAKLDYSTSNVASDSTFSLPVSGTDGFSPSNYDKAYVYYSGNTTYGTYYSWYAATAGTGTQSLESGDASGSICPKGWRLPNSTIYIVLKGKGTEKAGTWSKDSTTSGYWIGGTANASGAAFWYAAGDVYAGSLGSAGSVGYYWSSTADGDIFVHDLEFDSGRAPYRVYGNKAAGFSVRCVAQ